MGRHEVGFHENIVKIPENTGCRLEGKFLVNKVPGNFHLSTHSAHAQPQSPDMRHVIHGLTFGEEVITRQTTGSFDPLRGRDATASTALSSHDYVLKIVPSLYEELGGRRIFSYQYTVAHKEYLAYHHSGQILPALWFRYELTPITVKYTERRQPVYSFLTSVRLRREKGAE
jgi:endoplasmic reticulum-Golgi intermediate compartment protein 1